jgi:hypothetical protein
VAWYTKYTYMPERQFDKNRIEDVKKTLYSRNESVSPDERVSFSPHHTEVPATWNDEAVFEAQAMKHRADSVRRSTVRIFLLIASVFFIISASFAGYVLYHDQNSVSPSNVDITVSAPVSIGGGEEYPLQITVSNKNNASLEAVSLQVVYPEGTRDPLDGKKDLLRKSELLNTIVAGGDVTRKVSAMLFGEEHAIKKITISLEYRVKGSNAIFTKEKTVEVELASAPLSLAVSALKEVSADQVFELAVTITSNSATVVQGTLLSIQYPFGFKFVNAEPSPLSDNAMWKLGDFAPGEKRVIKVRGSMAGQNEDERAFRFVVGTADRVEQKRIGTTLVAYTTSVSIKKPFIGMEISVDGNTSTDYAMSANGMVQAEVRWKNNLPSRVADAVFEVVIRGASFDRSSVRVSGGFYRSVDNTIVFSKTEDSRLALLDPGESGTLPLTFSLIPPSSASGMFLQNQEVVIEASVRGKRMSGETALESLTGSAVRKVKVSSSLALTSRATYNGSPIPNTGPIPPRADKETTYTVTLTVTNTYNAVGGVRVTMPSPPGYVRWTGVTYPLSENIRQLDDGSIVWDVGEVKAYAGYVSAPREVSFQVAIIPSITHIGSTPQLVRPAELSGTDRFTNKGLTATGSSLDTTISTDPLYKPNDGKVIP